MLIDEKGKGNESSKTHRPVSRNEMILRISDQKTKSMIIVDKEVYLNTIVFNL